MTGNYLPKKKHNGHKIGHKKNETENAWCDRKKFIKKLLPFINTCYFWYFCGNDCGPN